jgi:hypothetical protein
MKEVTMTTEHKEYLIELRDSGVTNMWGASPYLAQRFDISEDEAGRILAEWIKSFREDK